MPGASKPIDQLLIVGAGLTGSLIALALRKLRPEIRFILIEQSARCGGGPVPPYFSESVPLDGRWLTEPLVVRQWANYAVALPDFVRSLAGSISMLVPEQIHAEVMEAIPQSRLRLGAKAVHIDRSGVVLADGEVIAGSTVIDTRAEPFPSTGSHWCHETDRMVRFPQQHGLDAPIVVDATLTAPDRTFLQYYPVDPHSLMIRYVCYSLASSNRQVSDVDLSSNGGKLEAEIRSRRPLLGWRDSPLPDASPRCVVARAIDAAYWHPVMSDLVGGAIRVATALAAESQISNGSLIPALARVGRGSRERLLLSAHVTQALCSEVIETQHHALRSFYALGREARRRFETGAPLAEDFERLRTRLDGPGPAQNALSG